MDSLKTLSLGELSAILREYPYFAVARKELCSRLLDGGDPWWKKSIFAQNAFQMPDRSILYDIYLSKIGMSKPVDFSETIAIEEHHRENSKKEDKKPQETKTIHRERRRAGGDFFSAEEYAAAGDGPVFNMKIETKTTPGDENIKVEFFTETLAEIYAEQGYYQQAILIYNQLILANPEKSAYFASLIEKLKQKIQ